MPHVNAFLRATEGSGAEIKLYGMSQIGVYESQDLVQETNLVKHAFGKRNNFLTPDLRHGDRLIASAAPESSAPRHRVTVHLPSGAERATFECREDQLLLNAGLRAGIALPFGCRMGSCGMCAGRILEGQVERAPQIILRDDQMDQGFTLLCKSRPRSDLVIVTHQESELGI
jgi:ferredoxin